MHHSGVAAVAVFYMEHEILLRVNLGGMVSQSGPECALLCLSQYDFVYCQIVIFWRARGLLRQTAADQDRGQLMDDTLLLFIQVFGRAVVVAEFVAAVRPFRGMHGRVQFGEIQDVVDDGDLGHDRTPVGIVGSLKLRLVLI
jgi:hypothetical protein